jgi:hypothetical protein
MKKLEKIKAALQKLIEVEMSYITTDKGILYFEGEDPKVDLQVWLKDENEENQTPESGLYMTDTHKYTIEGGRFSLIEEIERTEKEKFSMHKTEMSATYQEIERKLVDLMWELGYDCYLIENNSEYAIFNVWGENGEMYLRLDITVDEETGDILSLSNPTEMELKYVEKFEEQVEPTTEVVEEPIEEPTTVEPEPVATEEPVVEPEPVDKDKLLSEALAKIEDLTKELEEIKSKPSAKSPSEEFETVKLLEKTGDERIDNLLNSRGFLFSHKN